MKKTPNKISIAIGALIIAGCSSGSNTMTTPQTPNQGTIKLNNKTVLSQTQLTQSNLLLQYAAKIKTFNQQFQNPVGFTYIDPATSKFAVMITYKDSNGNQQYLPGGISAPDQNWPITAAAVSALGTLVVGLANGDVYKYNTGKSGWTQAPQKIIDGKNICVYAQGTQTQECNLSITTIQILPKGDDQDGKVVVGTGIKTITVNSGLNSHGGAGETIMPGSASVILAFNFSWTTYSFSAGG